MGNDIEQALSGATLHDIRCALPCDHQIQSQLRLLAEIVLKNHRCTFNSQQIECLPEIGESCFHGNGCGCKHHNKCNCPACVLAREIRKNME